MIFGTVSASERTAPVHGEQPSDRMRHMTSCGFSPGSSGTNGCSSMMQRVAAHDDLALLGEVERHDRNVLDVDVLPDVDLGPVRQRKDADALAGPDAAVQQVPQLGPLVLRIPLALRRRAARRCAPWRATAPRRAARRRTPRRSCPPRARRAATWSSAAPQQRCVPTRNGCVPSAIASLLVWTISRAPISAV